MRAEWRLGMNWGLQLNLRFATAPFLRLSTVLPSSSLQVINDILSLNNVIATSGTGKHSHLS